MRYPLIRPSRKIRSDISMDCQDCADIAIAFAIESSNLIKALI